MEKFSKLVGQLTLPVLVINWRCGNVKCDNVVVSEGIGRRGLSLTCRLYEDAVKRICYQQCV